jgi:hypothetical protein
VGTFLNNQERNATRAMPKGTIMANDPVAPLSDNTPQTTSSTVSDNSIPSPAATPPTYQVPNPIPAGTPASLGIATPVTLTAGPTAAAPNANAPAVRPAAPTPSPAQQAQQLHTSIFTKILGTLAGGTNRPVMGANGQPQTDASGQVVMAPASKKALGASILAGALSAMVAGMASPSKFNEVAPGRFQQDFSGAAAAGAAAGQPFTQAGSQAAAQEKANAATAAQYSATDHNLKLHAAMLGNLKLQGEVMNQGVQDDAPLIEAMKLNPTTTDANGKELSAISGEHVSETALQKMMADGSTHVTRDSVLRDGVSNVYDDNGKQIFNPDGTPRQEYTYSVYDHNAEIAMTDEMKKDNPRLANVAAGTTVPIAVLAKGNREKMDMQNAQGFVNQWANQVADFNGSTAKPVDIKAAIAKDPYLRKLVPQLGRYAGMEPDQVITQMDKDGVDPALIGKFSNLFGGIDKNAWNLQRANELQKQKDKDAEEKATAEANAKRQTPEGQAELKHKQLENQQLSQAIAQAQAQGQGIQVPRNFTANPKSAQMDAGTLQSDLASKGVSVPSNFAALYAIAHNDADLATLPTTPRKGVNVMPRDQALSYIKTFINPQYNEGDYSASKKLSGELASTRTGTAGGTLLSAGTAANHLNLLEQAGQALNNNDVQGINKLANSFGIAVGKSPAVTFQAIAEQVNNEVAKVVSGGNPNEPELKANRDTLNRDQSPEQIKNVIRAYIGLMNGRIGEIDDRSMQYFGRHVKGISPTTVQVFNKNGFVAPGQVVVVDPTGKQRFFNDAASADNFKKLAGIQ